MSKSPGFWFFTGDWLKDPELRFCSIFARGLLVDLLCYMFEAKEQGYMCAPSGRPMTNEQIVDAVSGGSREEKLAGLRELEENGVLSRDSRGVLFSRRLSRLKELSAKRRESGSKGGSKTQAKLKQTVKQTTEQTTKQNQGVTVTVSASDSVSDSDSVNTNTPLNPPKGKTKFDASKIQLPKELSHHLLQEAWLQWVQYRNEIRKPITEIGASKQIKLFEAWGIWKSIQAIENAIAGGYQGLFEPKATPALEKFETEERKRKSEESRRRCQAQIDASNAQHEREWKAAQQLLSQGGNP